MLKIGILTFAFSINYGAFLQAYSLREYLKRRYNKIATVGIVNYNSQKAEDFYRNDSDEMDLEKYDSFRKCWNQFDLEEQELITDDLSAVSVFLKKSKYDILIVGSDQLWRVQGFRGFPNAYWVNFDIGNSIKIAYAVSGRNDEQEMDEATKDYIVEALSTFDYVGVRDACTLNGLMPFTDKKIELNCDPTFLWDGFRATKKRVPDKRKKRVLLLVYCYPELSHKLYRLFRNAYDVVSVYEKDQKYTDELVFSITPFEWVELISSSTLVITDRFHGTVFSILGHVPFISLDREEYGKGKISDLLTRNSLEDYLYNIDDQSLQSNALYLDIFSKGHRIMEEPDVINYDDIIIREQANSKGFIEFLDEAIKHKTNG